MNSLFILFSVIRLSISDFFAPNLLPDEIGVGNYRVIKISSSAGPNSYFITLLNIDTKKNLKFKTVSDNDGYVKILVVNMNSSSISKTQLNLLVEVKFSVVRTEERQGRELSFAKW